MSRNQSMTKRQAITVAQRSSLREYARSHPYATQENIQTWFAGKYHIKLSQSAISKSLSDRFKVLDTPQELVESNKRRRLQRHPELEEALWLQLENSKETYPLSDDRLLSIADSLWKQIHPEEEALEKSLGHGWLQRFKKRFEKRNLHSNCTTVSSVTYSPNNESPSLQVYNEDGLNFNESYRNPDISDLSVVEIPHPYAQTQSGEVEEAGVADISVTNEFNSETEISAEHKLLTFREAIQCLRKLYVLEMVQKDSDPKQLSFYSKMEQVMFERMMKSYRE